MASPLTIDGALLDFHADHAAHGAPVEVFTVPMAGATAPVTLAGTITPAVAEFLGASRPCRRCSPGALIIGVGSDHGHARRNI